MTVGRIDLTPAEPDADRERRTSRGEVVGRVSSKRRQSRASAYNLPCLACGKPAAECECVDDEDECADGPKA